MSKKSNKTIYGTDIEPDTSYIAALDIVHKCITAYKRKAQLSANDETKAKFERYTSALDSAYREIKRIVPNHTVVMNGDHYCAECKRQINGIYPESNRLGIPLQFCPWCGQALSPYEYFADAEDEKEIAANA